MSAEHKGPVGRMQHEGKIFDAASVDSIVCWVPSSEIKERKIIYLFAMQKIAELKESLPPIHVGIVQPVHTLCSSSSDLVEIREVVRGNGQPLGNMPHEQRDNDNSVHSVTDRAGADSSRKNKQKWETWDQVSNPDVIS